MVSREEIKQKLETELKASHVVVDDISPDMCGTSFNVVVVSEIFCDKSRLEQQRTVNNLLAEELKSIHAFTLKTYTPELWKKKNADN